jgi:hypothetical protein
MLICPLLTAAIVCQITFPQFFSALHEVETPQGIIISSKEYVGGYEISWAYWYDSGVPGQWADCVDDKYSERVMIAYWHRYAKEALENKDFEVLARIHNGGPNGANKESTIKYWKMVKKELER